MRAEAHSVIIRKELFYQMKRDTSGRIAWRIEEEEEEEEEEEGEEEGEGEILVVV